MEYKHKMICEFIANGDYGLYKKLYEDSEASEVWDYLAIRRARGL
jgi:hypothetical protein